MDARKDRESLTDVSNLEHTSVTLSMLARTAQTYNALQSEQRLENASFSTSASESEATPDHAHPLRFKHTAHYYAAQLKHLITWRDQMMQWHAQTCSKHTVPDAQARASVAALEQQLVDAWHTLLNDFFETSESRSLMPAVSYVYQGQTLVIPKVLEPALHRSVWPWTWVWYALVNRVRGPAYDKRLRHEWLDALKAPDVQLGFKLIWPAVINFRVLDTCPLKSLEMWDAMAEQTEQHLDSVQAWLARVYEAHSGKDFSIKLMSTDVCLALSRFSHFRDRVRQYMHKNSHDDEIETLKDDGSYIAWQARLMAHSPIQITHNTEPCLSDHTSGHDEALDTRASQEAASSAYAAPIPCPAPKPPSTRRGQYWIHLIQGIEQLDEQKIHEALTHLSHECVQLKQHNTVLGDDEVVGYLLKTFNAMSQKMRTHSDAQQLAQQNWLESFWETMNAWSVSTHFACAAFSVSMLNECFTLWIDNALPFDMLGTEWNRFLGTLNGAAECVSSTIDTATSTRH